MNHGLIFGFLLFLCCNQLFAQGTTTDQIENDYREFREVFDRELKSLDESGKTNVLTFHPASLPKWLTDIPESSPDVVYAIGISDPGMESEKAIKLAKLRAKIIAALLLNPKISSITDNYSKENNHASKSDFITKYVNYYRLLASINGNDEQFEVVSKDITTFGEAILLLKYDTSIRNSEISDSIMLKIDFYTAERQIHNRFEFEEKCEVFGLSKKSSKEQQIDIFYYYYRAVNQFYEIVSRYNGDDIGFPQTLFRYQSLTGSEINTSTESLSFKLTNGLWKAYLQSILQSYTLAVFNPEVEIAQMGEHYTSSSQNLSRELIRKDPAFRLKGLLVKNNCLTVLLNNDESKQ